jgi:oligo-1,6-glucosidase
VNPNHTEINAAVQMMDSASVFHHHRRLIALRREHPVLVHGAYRDLDPDHASVFAYTRTLGDEVALVLLNLCGEPLDYPLPSGLSILDTWIAEDHAVTPAPGAVAVSLAAWHASVHLLA